jgi:hypothetical protein
MVSLILAFIFLTPRGMFRDQPKPKSVTMLPAEHGTTAFWIEADLLNGGDEAERLRKATEIVRGQASGKNRNLVRLETIYDAEDDIRGYLVYTRP